MEALSLMGRATESLSLLRKLQSLVEVMRIYQNEPFYRLVYLHRYRKTSTWRSHFSFRMPFDLCSYTDPQSAQHLFNYITRYLSLLPSK